MALTQADVLERRVSRDREKRERGLRVTILQLPRCDACHGTTAEVEDQSLRCICEARSSELRARLARLVQEHSDPGQYDLGARIAP